MSLFKKKCKTSTVLREVKGRGKYRLGSLNHKEKFF